LVDGGAELLAFDYRSFRGLGCLTLAKLPESVKIVEGGPKRRLTKRKASLISLQSQIQLIDELASSWG